MCISRKQILTAIGLIAAFPLTSGNAFGGQGTAAGVALGGSQGGVTDRAYLSTPPNYSFVVGREPGSFIDCGAGMDVRIADEDGRDMASLNCGVTLTETLAIPAAAESARVIVHF